MYNYQIAFGLWQIVALSKNNQMHYLMESNRNKGL